MESSEEYARRRLRLLHELTRSLTTFTDLPGLLRFAIQRIRELFQAEGCSVLMVDADRGEFFFPAVAGEESGASARFESLRFPIEQGIAGWVLANDRSEFVPNVATDPRFFGGIDESTRMTTRSMLCAPLRTRSGNIGVIEVVNPSPEFTRPDDLEFLETFAADIAVACEKASLYEKMRAEIVGLRQVCRVSGGGLVAIGLLLVAGGALHHIAVSQPLSELPAEPAVLLGVLAALAGGILFRASGRWGEGLSQ